MCDFCNYTCTIVHINMQAVLALGSLYIHVLSHTMTLGVMWGIVAEAAESEL